MPKPKPDEVIRHEIVLGKVERDMMRDTLGAYQFNKISSPLVAGLSDVTFVLTVTAILGYGIGAVLDRVGLDPNWREIVGDLAPDELKDWLETQNLQVGGLGALIGLFLGGPVGAAVGGVAGGAIVEGYEELDEATRESDAVQRLINWWNGLNLPDWAQSDGGLGSQGL
tara:strand:- start:510 stop:1016 length:507 start_codon:yes stop_codon:yes gene_type:complete